MFDEKHKKTIRRKDRLAPRKNCAISVHMNKWEMGKLKELAVHENVAAGVYMRDLFLRELGRLGISRENDFFA